MSAAPDNKEKFSTRPRIRSFKPEGWHDEKIGRLSRDARLLFVALITMADDEGRFRARPAVILGHAYPYDDDAPRKLERWLVELEDAALIGRYTAEGMPYGAIPNFLKHQSISKSGKSVIPRPPFPTFSRNGSGTSAEGVRT